MSPPFLLPNTIGTRTHETLSYPHLGTPNANLRPPSGIPVYEEQTDVLCAIAAAMVLSEEAVQIFRQIALLLVIGSLVQPLVQHLQPGFDSCKLHR